MLQTGGKKQLDLYPPDGGYGQWVAIDVTELPQQAGKNGRLSRGTSTFDILVEVDGLDLFLNLIISIIIESSSTLYQESLC